MSNTKDGKFSDILGLSEPICKLIETVSCGVGKLYEPTNIRRLAKAKAEEIKIISDAVTDNCVVPVNYQNSNVGIDTTDANALYQRAQNRFLFQQMKKQQNIDSVIANAYTEVNKKNVVSDEPVDECWVSSFFDFVANVSSEQMQILWGKVLAGEVEKPNSFSIRTLDILRKMTQEDAVCFSKIIPYIIKCPGDKEASFYDYFLPANLGQDDQLAKKYGIAFSYIVRLDEAGLISSNSLISVGTILRAKESVLFEGASTAVHLLNCGENPRQLHHLAFLLTEAGKELLPIVSALQQESTPNEYMKEFTESILETNIENSMNMNIEVNFC